MNHKKTALLLILVLNGLLMNAQSIQRSKNQVSILFGLTQPLLLRGFNIEGNYWMKKFVVDYSHGLNLHLYGKFVGGQIEQQQLDLKVTHSLGVGFGYRFTEGFNLRIEPKLHLFEVYYKGEQQNSDNRVGNYSTFTLGLGAYYCWLPFREREGGLRGLTIAPSVRFWPNVSSSLDDNPLIYFNKITGKNEEHQAANIGAANSPWILNVSVGYTFK